MLSPNCDNEDVVQATDALCELKGVATCEAASIPLSKFWAAYDRLSKQAQYDIRKQVREDSSHRLRDFFNF